MVHQGQHQQQQQSSASAAARMQACVHSLLCSIQEDPARQGLLDTPKRVAKAMLDMTEGYRADPALLLSKALFDEPDVEQGAGGLVLVRDIDFAALSQDTLLPFYGRCHIAYVPSNGVILGLSKLARLTKLCAKQLHTQDGLARLVLHYLQKQLQPKGALVVVQARHLDYTAQQPPQLQSCAAASGSLAAGWPQQPLGDDDNSSSSAGSGATLEEVLELLGVPIAPEQVQLLPDAAHPLCLLPPTCNCHSARSSTPAATTPPLADSRTSSFGSLQLSTTAACSTCGASRLAPHVLRGMSASAGGFDSPRAPVTPDPSENSDTDGSEQGSDLYCASLLAGSGDMPSQVLDALLPAAAAAAVADCSFGTAAGASIGRAGAPTAAAAAHSTGPQSLQQQQLGSTVAMEAAVLQLLAEAGADTTAAAVQAAARRHVLALLAATAGYKQEQPSRPMCACRRQQQQGREQQQQHSSSGVQVQQQYQQFEHHVPFMSQCEHHMLPFHGAIHIQYLLPAPGSSGSGSSSSSGSDGGCHCCHGQPQPLSQQEAQQLVQCYTKRLQVQERITQQVAAAVQRLLQPVGVMVVVQAAHMCMVARGVENHAGSTSTRAALGVYEADPQLRVQFLRRVREQQQQQQEKVVVQQEVQQQPCCGC